MIKELYTCRCETNYYSYMLIYKCLYIIRLLTDPLPEKRGTLDTKTDFIVAELGLVVFLSSYNPGPGP